MTIDESLRGINTETWQPEPPVSSSSRPQHNYVPEVRRAEPMRVPDGWNGVAAVDLQPVDVSGVMEAANDGSRDSTSATDRAIGYVIRLGPAFLLALLLAVMGMVAFILIMRHLDTQTDSLTNFFVFLVCIGVTFGLLAVTMNRQDYQHSRAGVERHRISTAAQLRTAEITAMLTLRREALGHTIAMLEAQSERRQIDAHNG